MSRRHIIVPDTQCKKGVPTEHLSWAAQAIIEYKPDVIVHMGDHWDMPSLSLYDAPGSKKMEGARYEDDIRSGNDAFRLLADPIANEILRLRRNKKAQWNPERHFLFGNHENRVERAISKEPKFEGVLSLEHMDTREWTRHGYLQVVHLDGIAYSHFFQSSHSPNAIGGSIDNRLNKIGESFVQGHVQGFMYGNRMFPTGKTKHGLVCGSFYQHEEEYRGPQGNQHWNGIVVLNEVKDGDFDVMPLSIDYLRRKYER
jgi:hypothetical protein